MRSVIIKKIPIREYDELVVCYTEDFGKQAYQAKSILKPGSTQAGHLDVLNLADFNLIEGNGYPIITSAYCLNAFSKLKSSLGAMTAAFFILELFDKTVMAGEKDAKLWDFLFTNLNRLNNEVAGSFGWKQHLLRLHGEALDVLGYSLETSIEEVAGRPFRSLQLARNMIE